MNENIENESAFKAGSVRLLKTNFFYFNPGIGFFNYKLKKKILPFGWVGPYQSYPPF
jgi:hypothetical protein